MIVTVFRSRLMPGFKDEYVALVDRMHADRQAPSRATSRTRASGPRTASASPSSSSSTRRASAPGGCNAEHMEAQRLGRTKYYETYDIQVCNVLHEAHYDRKKDAKAGS